MPRRIQFEGNVYNSQIAYTTYSDPIDVARCKGFFVQSTVTDGTPSAKSWVNTSVNATADTITIVGHGLATGLVGRVTTTGDRPGGINANTDYFVISLTANTIQLAASLSDAIAGTNINFSDNGNANSTFTATAFSGMFFLQQYDGTTWTNTSGSNTAVSANSSVYSSQLDPMYKYARIAHFMTAGYARFSDNVIVKEDFLGS